MWTRLKQTAKSPFQLLRTLRTMQDLLREQNLLLREIHFQLAQRHASTPPSRLTAAPVRRRSGGDVWRRASETSESIRQHENIRREMAASSPASLAVAGSPRIHDPAGIPLASPNPNAAPKPDTTGSDPA